MTFHVFNTESAPEDFEKDLTNRISPAAGWSGAVRGELSVDQPNVRIEATVTVGNYVKIDELARYYWITEKNVIREGLTELTLESDPLMSFKDGILALDIEVTRCAKQAIEGSESGYNAMLHDSEIKVSCQRTFREFPFTISGTSTRMSMQYPGTEYILAVIG